VTIRSMPFRFGGHFLKFILGFLPTKWINSLFTLSLRRPCAAIRNTSRVDPAVLEYLGQRKALAVFRQAWTRTPAYRDFLEKNGVRPREIASLSDFLAQVPLTTKANYIRCYSLSARCHNGVLPRTGSLDESAGTTADPLNWIRDSAEDKARHPMGLATIVYLYGLGKRRPWILLNGYVLGAWAGGARFASGMSPFGIVKNTGPDAARIVHTIQTLGPEYDYLIGGYPPFLKELVDYGQKVPGFKWKSYCVNVLTGGEGFVEEWRDYMASRLAPGARIYSNYGAIDTDAVISTENFLTVGIKRLAAQDAGLRQALFASERMPCYLGQYSPLDFFIHPSVSDCGAREFDVTVLSSKIASPRIRYNVGDEGGIVPYARMRSILEGRGYRLEEIMAHPDGFPPIPFPFLFLFGRSDGTVFFDGATISPSDIQSAILADAELAAKVRTFKISITEDDGTTPRPAIDLELKEGVEGEAGPKAKRVRTAVLGRLLASNSCYRKAFDRNPDGAAPRVRVYSYQTGPFKKGGDRPKFRYRP